MVKRPAFSFLPLAFLCSFAFADEHTNDVHLYFHPLTLPINPFVLGSMWYDDRPLTVHLTLEYSLNKNFSIPATPSFWLKHDDYYKLGSGAGIRYYVFDNGRLIFQITAAHYLKRSLPSDSNAHENLSERITDIYAYIGFGDRVHDGEPEGAGGFYMNIGIGSSPNRRGISVDANLAIGIRIL
jgi:hypothetical protein